MASMDIDKPLDEVRTRVGKPRPKADTFSSHP